MPDETLTVTDNRTGRRYEIPIRGGAIAAADLQKITSDGSGSGLLSYDPAFLNTASCRSAITFIDGERRILGYRGYPVEELAERSSFLEVAYLLIHGELPDPTQHREWVQAITHHTLLHENIKKLIDGFHHDAHPMWILAATVAPLSTFYPDAKDLFTGACAPPTSQPARRSRAELEALCDAGRDQFAPRPIRSDGRGVRGPLRT